MRVTAKERAPVFIALLVALCFTWIVWLVAPDSSMLPVAKITLVVVAIFNFVLLISQKR